MLESARCSRISRASFDSAMAGLPRVVLIEEPQAAFYDYIARFRKDLARVLRGTRLALVVDADVRPLVSSPGEAR